jgi:cytosine/adenosine deaminase-related metal-dependent hydrolase
VVNVASFPELIDPIEDARANRPVGGLRVIWCLELLDFNRPAPVEELMREAEAFVDSRPRLTGRYGFSPHAPYSTSSGLYLAAARAAKARSVPLVTHLAESTEEDDMFRRGTGPMYDYFLRAGRDMRDCKRVGVVQMLDEAGVLGPHCLAAHANCLTPMDIQKLQSTHTNVVLCPHTHRFFGRGQPMLEAWWAAGINVCLGSDSLASNEKLDLLAEMQTLSHMFPRIAPERVLRMATLDAAAALPDGHRLGRLAPEATADLIALPLGEETVDPYESVVFAEGGVCFSMVEGKVLIG